MIEFFLKLDIKIQAALIAALTSIITLIISTYLKSPIEKRLHKHRLKLNFEYEQRKKIKDTIAQYKGQIIQAANSINGRVKNLTKNREKAVIWMNAEYNDDINKNYYIKSFIYRILSFFAWVKILEDRIIFLDTTIASKKDILFIKMLKIMPQFFFDGDIVEGIELSQNQLEKDIIYSDNFKLQYLWMIQNENVISFEEFKTHYKENYSKFSELAGLLRGINDTEDRLRFDRLIGFHLFITGLLNKFGYDYQKTSYKYLNEIINRHNKTSTFKNIKKHIFEKYKFGKYELRNIYCILKKYGS